MLCWDTNEGFGLNHRVLIERVNSMVPCKENVRRPCHDRDEAERRMCFPPTLTYDKSQRKTLAGYYVGCTAKRIDNARRLRWEGYKEGRFVLPRGFYITELLATSTWQKLELNAHSLECSQYFEFAWVQWHSIEASFSVLTSVEDTNTRTPEISQKKWIRIRVLSIES